MLECPACRALLAETDRCAACGAEFPTCGGLPVLIDFSDSIFQADEYGPDRAPPDPPRSGAVARFARRLTFGANHVAPGNIQAFMDGLAGPKVLVVGGGTIGSGIEALYARDDLEIVEVDVYPSPHIALICDGHKLPFADSSFDGVVIQAVLEHVLDPPSVVAEIHRVLKPGGMLYAETPFMQQVHEGAYDFTRFTFNGHRWLFRRFTEVAAGQAQGPGLALLWAISYFARATTRSNKAAAAITALFFWVRFLDRFATRGPALDAACGIYFLGRKSDDSLKPTDLPDYYERHRSA